MSVHLENAQDVDFIIKTAIERDPKKRRVKPVETQASILDFDLEESSDDSDFRIEDHPDVSDDDEDSCDSNGAGGGSSDGEEEEVESEGSDYEAEFGGLSLGKSNGLSIAEVLEKAKSQQSDASLKFNDKDTQVLICCGCLGDQSDGVNEIVECDSCGVTVHEACYGISDTASMGSTDSLSPTAPWFCEACKAGVKDPICELCPNSGGIFKETDVGKWVHLVCALYVPGVAFGEVDKLSSVTLFEMQYSKWGAKSCSLCQDERFARTGVCIGCDAGMCKTYFHVTCAQREGFLSEAHSEEVDQADPFYAHCKLHSDKMLVRRRRRNYLALQLRTHYRRLQFEQEGHSDTPEQLRIHRKLEKQREHYFGHKVLKAAPWVPTQKMPRLLTTSASACRKLLRKAELMGIDTSAVEMQEAQVAALVDIRKKWHIPPAFTVEFIAYYLDRNDRLKGMKNTLEKHLETNHTLLDEQQTLRSRYDQLLKEKGDELKLGVSLQQNIERYHATILQACAGKKLPNVDDLGKPTVVVAPPPQKMMVPTAAALKMGVGFPLNNVPAGRHDRVLSSHARQDPLLLNECGICRQRRDQHMLAKCDTCHLYYHLNCLNPPLTRLPKKSKLYGWQCSECDKTSDSEIEEVKTPRRSRSRYSREEEKHEVFTPKVKIKPVEEPPPNVTVLHMKNNYGVDEQHQKHHHHHHEQTYSMETSVDGQPLVISTKSGKKRRRDKHRSRYSPELGGGGSTKEHKRKRKKKCLEIESPVRSPTPPPPPPPNPLPRITIKIKPIPLPAGEVPSTTNPQCFYVPNADEDTPPPQKPRAIEAPPSPLMLPPPPPPKLPKSAAPTTPAKEKEMLSRLYTSTPIPFQKRKMDTPIPASCDVCEQFGSSVNMVSCDECRKYYHFTCLDPPLKKSPKKRGYSWHCADCDPTASE